jgi:hypothetical protein
MGFYNWESGRVPNTEHELQQFQLERERQHRERCDSLKLEMREMRKRRRSYMGKPKRGRRLLMRSRRHRRLLLLRQFEVDRVYTFPAFHEWIIPDEMNLLMNDKPEGLRV